MIKVEIGRLQLDSLSIIPSSVSIQSINQGALLDSSFYQIDNNYISFIKFDSLKNKSLQISYRVFPFNLQETFSHLDTTQAKVDESGKIIGFDYNPFESSAQLIDFKGLDYNGSFARGISFGNNQDLVLNSSFNLQLAGNLGEGVEILAAITDENIPLQPEGNTQQLREFDRIFIQLKKGRNKLVAGDYELQRPNSYFMNYFKKLQGATYSNQTQLSKKGYLNSQASIAISRGKFARNTIIQQEGNQGPYKLRGEEGERFIIILAGTEKVWLDGELLVRGLEQDYVIDYNRGEVRFTNKRLITKDSRIIIEFEYSDQNYLRSMYAINTTYEQEKFRLYFNLFNQQDSKNSTGVNELSELEKTALRNAGDQLENAIVPTIDTIEEFSNFRVSYKLIDTLISCPGVDTTIQILQFSTNPDSATYTARFTFVGLGNGDYILDTEAIANERVYRWIAPDPLSCNSRGDYAPIGQLLAPQQQRLITIGSEYRFSSSSGIQTEVAISQNDQNRFSKLDSEDDQGLAAFTTFNKAFSLGRDTSDWSLNTQLSYEYVQKDFKALNPYRAPEFLRDWNIANIQGIGTAPKAEEQLGRGGITLRKEGLGQVEYSFSTFLRDSIYTGYRHFSQLSLEFSGWKIDGESSWLSTDETERKTQFFRPNFSVVKSFRKLANWKIGLNGEREQSERFDTFSDTLNNLSFQYDRYKVFVESPSGQNYSLGAFYSQRRDFVPVGKGFEQNTIASEANINGQWRLKRFMQLSGNFTYRQLEVIDPNLTTQEPAETYLGRMNVNFNLFKGTIRSNTAYEIGSGQEPKLEFSYVPVTPGSGTHIWLDSLFNNDGKIQLNEMEIAPFQDLADFVRVTTFTDEFIRTNNVLLNQSIQINPKAIWYSAKGFKKLLSKFATQSTLKINRKTQDAPFVSPWNPFQLSIPDTALVAISSSIRNILFFNRSNPKYDLQIGQTDNRNRTVQTSGFESRRNAEQFLRGRWNISRSISTQVSLTQGQRESDSEFFDNRDYQIDFLRLEPQFTFLPSKNFRTILRYKFQKDENTLVDKGEQSEQHDFKLELTYNGSATSSIRTEFSFVKVQFDGQANSPVGFAMLNGLQNGQNFLWNISLNRQLAQNIQLNLSYEGRKTGTARVVHVGRAQVAATF